MTQQVIMRRAIVREGARYKIYMPTELNDLWAMLRGRKVKVIVELPADVAR